MTLTLKDLLLERGVKTALIVDDAVDSVPTADDVGVDNDAWASFNDDLTEDKRQRISEVFPAAANVEFDKLIRDDAYVAAVWGLRAELGDVVTPVFADYERDQETDGTYVEQVKQQLLALGLDVQAAGRDFVSAAAQVDLVVIDLFLGKAQNPEVLEASKKGLRETLAKRQDNPPMVILMSRSPRLEAKRDEFRDEVGLLDSGFRILKKEDLNNPVRLERQLERLAASRSDSVAFAKLLLAFEKGIAEGANRTVKLLRKLRLSDIGQIQQLLLDQQQHPVGSYLVDVFDRVLQHEIEREDGIIDAALALNDFSPEKYPPPYVAGSPDLQELVRRTLTQNENRLRLPTGVNANVAFGDLLIVNDDADVEEVKKEILVDIKKDNVLLVLTPACDLQRRTAPRVLLLVGVLNPLAVKEWTYLDDVRTPAIRIDEQVRWVKWNSKHIDTVSFQQLDEALAKNRVKIVGRLREGHALELQQRVLSGLGRIGQLAPLPGTFPVDLEVFYVGADEKLKRLEVDQLSEGAVYFAGRDGKRLMMTETVCDGILVALASLDINLVSAHSQPVFKHVTTSLDLQHLMMSGFNLQNVSESWKEIPAQENANSVKTMGYLSWNPNLTDETQHKSWQKKAGVIFVIRDLVLAGANIKDLPGLDTVRQELAAMEVQGDAKVQDQSESIPESVVEVQASELAPAAMIDKVDRAVS
ncbi:hypothetical protein [uncultured Herbaspirillum sp.]|uniref:hypothetical protein n=1 Tax=uncultured Herbaspirillum sp. TaxID=160236 RepID=UPI00262DB9C7|nr:hypothetical protein [uncultured Herbaspirillum sp.]